MKNITEQFKLCHPLLWRKMDILCHGISDDDLNLLNKHYHEQNPLHTHRTGNSGLRLELGDEKLILNVAAYNPFTMNSPYKLAKSDNLIKIIDCRDSWQETVSFSKKLPDWYFTKLSNDCQIGDYIQFEGNSRVIASITAGCVYFDKKVECKFCAMGKIDNVTESEVNRQKAFIESLKIIANEPDTEYITLTGGNNFSKDRGAFLYMPLIISIKDFLHRLKLCIEISPPNMETHQEIFSKYKELGVYSLAMNMEFWDDSVRSNLMPAKCKISKKEYMKVLETAILIFGKGRVSSGFIVGIENKEASYNGMAQVAKIGVIPEVYPFKPNLGSAMEGCNITETNIMVEASIYANELMIQNGIDPTQCGGCVKCGSCGLTQQLYTLYNNSNTYSIVKEDILNG